MGLLKNLFPRICSFSKKFVFPTFSAKKSTQTSLENSKEEDSLYDFILKKPNPGDSKLTDFDINYKKKVKLNQIYKPIPKYQRIGTFGIKLGSTSMYSKRKNKSIEVTMIQLKDNIVLDKRIIPSFNEKLPRLGVLCAGIIANHEEKYEKQIYEFYHIEPRRKLKQFYVDPDCAPNMGDKIDVTYYRVGQLVNVSGIRGHLGVMQRWGFKGLPASHGVSLSHRAPGGLGGFKKRVYPGMKMAGHTGLKKVVQVGCKILRINTKHNVLYLNGCVPGYKGAPVTLRDTVCRPLQPNPDPLPEDIFFHEVMVEEEKK